MGKGDNRFPANSTSNHIAKPLSGAGKKQKINKEIKTKKKKKNTIDLKVNR
jgi:hypothetical protein